MTVALVSTNPFTICKNGSGNPLVFGDVPNPLTLPNGAEVSGIAAVPWTSQDGAFSLVAVAPFVPPAGQQTTGAPSYSIDANGNVTETYATQAIPAVIPSCQLWQLEAAMTPAQLSAAQAAVASLNNPAVTEFFAHGTNTIPANSTTLLALGEAIGLTADQVTALVLAASAISIP